MPFEHRLSSNTQDRLEKLLSQADLFFQHSWLRQALYDNLCQDIKGRGSYKLFCQMIQEEKEKRFRMMYLMAYQSSLREVRTICESPFSDDSPIIELARERENLIEDYITHPLSTKWDRVSVTKPESWKAFARRINYDNPEEVKSLEAFLHLLDKICIITDIICKKEGRYGIDISESSYSKYAESENTNKQGMDRERLKRLLIKVLPKCNLYFYGNTSWTIVRKVCMEDHGFTANKSEFERFATEINAELIHPMDYPCPPNTISSAEQANEYLKHTISEWNYYGVNAKVINLLNCLRTEIAKELQKEPKS